VAGTGLSKLGEIVFVPDRRRETASADFSSHARRQAHSLQHLRDHCCLFFIFLSNLTDLQYDSLIIVEMLSEDKSYLSKMWLFLHTGYPFHTNHQQRVCLQPLCGEASGQFDRLPYCLSGISQEGFLWLI